MCGHYHKTLKGPCKDAKRRKTVCESGTLEDASTSGAPHCGIAGCDRKAGLKREGPGKTLGFYTDVVVSKYFFQVLELMVDSTKIMLTGMIIK